MPRRLALPTLLAALAALAAACSSNPAPVPVAAASPDDLSALSGEWRGEYRAEQSGRSGGIVFVVEPGSDTAHGDVLMVPPGTELPYAIPRRDGRARSGVATGAMTDPATQLLRISFVRIADGRVRGVLEPYEAPDCRCVVHTEFEGRLAGDRIEGTFVTTGARPGATQRGRWSVTRSREPSEGGGSR